MRIYTSTHALGHGGPRRTATKRVAGEKRSENISETKGQEFLWDKEGGNRDSDQD